MGVGNLVKEILLSALYINPPFAFLATKEKCKCISASMQTQKKNKTKFIYLFIFIFIFFPSARTHSPVHVDGNFIYTFIFIILFSTSAWMGPTFAWTATFSEDMECDQHGS
jgi:hypothetical protein